jgi:formate dehydrogenase subunit delta
MSVDKLVVMANQIGKFFAPQAGGRAVESIANHLQRFWDPRMRSAIVAHVAAGGEGLDEAVRLAVGRLKEAKAKSPTEAAS